MRRFLLDAREMLHPEPLEKAIAILRGLDGNSYLYMLHRMNPVPLVALANDYSLNWISKEVDEVWHILISPNQNINLEQFIDYDLIKHQEAVDVSR